jgi:hypothetical protein
MTTLSCPCGELIEAESGDELLALVEAHLLECRTGDPPESVWAALVRRDDNGKEGGST